MPELTAQNSFSFDQQGFEAFLDSRDVGSGERVLVLPGSRLRFGRVECLYLTPDIFWTLVHSPA